MKYFAYFIILVVAAAIIGGFFIIGSPKEARLQRFDDQRIMDLQAMQSQIVSYWQNNEKLPARLEDLVDDISGFRVPKDPETQGDYRYEIKGERQFILCAKFNFPSPGEKNPRAVVPVGPYSEQNWDHPAGEHCFERTINPETNPPLKGRPVD